jgi:1-acyl-sn-glycerol-3-phosphate acyltransferase
LSRDTPAPAGIDGPVIIYGNHSAWWDPLVSLFLARRFFAQRRSYAPIAAAALQRYRFFSRLGFFGVEDRTLAGAKQFLSTAGAILSEPDSLLWLTPQGRFADVRERPLRFEPGLAHLAKRGPNVRLLPLALEYVYWEERLPEILLRFGPALVGDSTIPTESWNQRLEQALESNMNNLRELSLRRDPMDFEILLSGGAGVGGVYDLWRRAKALWRGERFDPAHGEK